MGEGAPDGSIKAVELKFLERMRGNGDRKVNSLRQSSDSEVRKLTRRH
jgi:hypothetical protein